MPRSRVATTRAVSNAIDTVVEAAYQARDNVVAWHVEPRLLRDDLRERLAACVVSSFGAEADNRRGINAGHATGATQLTGSALVRLAAEMQTALRCKNQHAKRIAIAPWSAFDACCVPSARSREIAPQQRVSANDHQRSGAAAALTDRADTFTARANTAMNPQGFVRHSEARRPPACAY